MYSEETSVYLAIISGCALIVLVLAVFVITIIHYQRRKIMLQQERITLEINALEKEKARIASDLHDDFGASLSAIKLHLQLIKPVTEREASLIEKAEEYLDESVLKLKAISFAMMPHILERNGLPDALRELVDMLISSTGLKIHFECNYNPVNNEIRIHIYRVVQEMLNNIIKHANASVVTLIIQERKNHIFIHINDNGKGFDETLIAKQQKGLGLQNIMARVRVLHASVALTTSIGQGVDYEIKIPKNIVWKTKIR